MEVNLEQAIQMMDTLWAQRQIDQLQAVAREISQKRPATAQAWRYLGIADILQGRNEEGLKNLRGASFMDDAEAAVWISVMSQFAHHPAGSVCASDVLNQVGFEKMRRSAYMNYPHEVTLETQAVCNAKCTFCPYSTMARQGDKMPDELIDKIIGDLEQIPRELPFVIAPFKVSDPFLDKRIFSICEKINARLPNARLRLFTNGSPLTDAIVEKVAAIKNVVHLWISLNEYEAQPYEMLMSLPFDRTIEKLDRLHQRVSQAGGGGAMRIQ